MIKLIEHTGAELYFNPHDIIAVRVEKKTGCQATVFVGVREFAVRESAHDICAAIGFDMLRPLKLQIVCADGAAEKLAARAGQRPDLPPDRR